MAFVLDRAGFESAGLRSGAGPSPADATTAVLQASGWSALTVTAATTPPVAWSAATTAAGSAALR